MSRDGFRRQPPGQSEAPRSILTKAHVVADVTEALSIKVKEAQAIVEVIFDRMVRALREGDKVEIRGFGVFRTRQRAARVGRNPRTGVKVAVPAKRIPYFKPSKALNDLLNARG